MVHISRIKAGYKLLAQANNGRIFSATYLKTDGSVRSILARRRVKKGVNGKGMRYNAIELAKMPVFDMQKQQFRIINLDTLISFKINGVEYKVY